MDFYPRAKGHMAEVWAKCECPICGEEMNHVDDEYETDDDLGKLHLDTYACQYCWLMLTYVSPQKYHEYHEVPDKDRRYLIERMI